MTAEPAHAICETQHQTGDTMKATRRIDSTGIAHAWDASDNDYRHYGTNDSLGLALLRCGSLDEGAAQDIDGVGRALTLAAMAYLDSCELIVRVNVAQQAVENVTVVSGGVHDFATATDALAWMHDKGRTRAMAQGVGA